MKTFVSCIIIAFAVIQIKAQTGNKSGIYEPLRVTRTQGGITFDGVPDEEVWQAIEALPLTMFFPVPGKEPTELSVIKMAYDNEFFYVSAYINYTDTKLVRAIGKQRDYSDLSSDFFGFTLDTFNDRENGVQFITNPNGLRFDATIKNDIVDEDTDRNKSWNTFWDVNTNINDQGWSTEFRIPFSSLRFQTINGKTLMGLLIVRWSAGKSELVTYPAVSPVYSSAYFKPSLSQVIQFEGLEPRKPVYITPYIIGGIGQINEPDDSSDDYKMNTTPKFDIGGDIKYSLTNNLTLDLTVNTDFAQVEADNQMINLTRYSLYFPEKRVFFLEKSDVFDFSFLQGNNLFYSRRIGLYAGNAVRIYGGARVTGRVGNWDLGFLDMQTAKFENNPSENFGVLRLKRNVFNQNSFIGGMVTSRLGMNGTYNVSYGLDGQFRVIGNEYLLIRLAQSFEDGATNRLFDLSPVRMLMQWQRRNNLGLGYDFQYAYAGESYNPGIGFERKKSYHGPVASILYGWMPERETFIRRHIITLSGYNYWNAQTGLHETTNAELNWYWESKKLFGGTVDLNWYLEDIIDTLILGNYQAYVPPGQYSFGTASLGYSSAKSQNLAASLSSTAGSFYDGWRLSFYVSPSYKIGGNFDIGLTYYLDYVDFPDRSMEFTNHIFGMRGLMTLTTKTSVNAFIQYNTAINKVISNIRFRYNPREGNDFYIVYDDTQNTYLDRESPALPHCAGRTILLKYTYTFRL